MLLVNKSIKTIVGIINFDSILLAKANPNEGKTNAQEPKQEHQGPEFNFNEDDDESNLNKSGTRDVTAYDRNIKRARSPRNSNLTGAKGDSVEPSQQK